MIFYLLLFFIFAITFSFLCSLWEAVLLSITPTYAQIKLYENTFVGKQLQYFKDNIDRPLAAILTLNTIAHTVGAIGVGEQAALIWANTNPFATKVLVPIMMTMSILILSEIIPKTIGANHWEKLASFTVYSLTYLAILLHPIVWLCQLVTKMIRKKKDSRIFSRADFLVLAEIGERQGVFEESEADLIEKSLDLHELHVTEVMRPVNDMITINKDESMAELISLFRQHHYSRYPVFDPTRNELMGIIHVKDILAQVKDVDQLDGLIRPILKVPQHLPLKNLLSRFREGSPHFALVYKGKKLLGFVTLDNILQVLFGIIKDEFHPTHVDWKIDDDGIVSVRGRCSVYALEQILDKDINVVQGVETLAGLILDQLGSIPKEGDRIDFPEFTAVVEKMNVAQISSVKIYPKLSNGHMVTK